MWDDRMSIFRLRRMRTDALVATVCALLLFYFIHHSLTGRYGIFSYHENGKRIANLETNLLTLKKQQTDLQKRTRLLYTEQLDLDMLEEQTRKKLFLTRDNEIVIYLQ